MQADSMINRPDSAKTMPTPRNAMQRASYGRIPVVAAAVLFQAILILGFVATSLGLGADFSGGVGPDRPPPPARIT